MKAPEKIYINKSIEDSGHYFATIVRILDTDTEYTRSYTVTKTDYIIKELESLLDKFSELAELSNEIAEERLDECSQGKGGAYTVCCANLVDLINKLKHNQ